MTENTNPFNEADSKITGEIACISCGASLKYKPGTDHLSCGFCGAENEIPLVPKEILELDFNEYLEKFESAAPVTEVKTVQCKNCAATTSLPPNVTSMDCPYCTTPLIVEQCKVENVITPHALVPFKLNANQASEKFRSWIKGLWFAPNKLQKMAMVTDTIRGIYTPYWTYDANTHTFYVGQRGTWHYRTVSYTAVENGKTVSKTRQEKYTVWTMASGKVDNIFDDILVNASNSIPRNMADGIEPWPLGDLKPFTPEFLSGFLSEKYQVDLKNGFGIAKSKMEKEINQTVCRDIGGDEQRVISMNTDYRDITFKHVLLPIFISAYKYNNKVYRFMVNGATGKVKGERPWSVAKIVLAVLAVLAVIGIIALIMNATKG
ncbi:MAG: DNA helicase PriA [Flavobacteriales bacterium]|nr:DNA helicase PriA [Flavobacteriales bacterium]